jgi:glycine dehydrogenase subunit 2
MKYNPKLADEVAGLPGLTGCHPGSPAELVPGWLRLLADLEAYLCEITGMAAASFQPPAGAAGELTGLLMIRAYHASRGDPDRRVVVIPDSAHGTNPASVTMAGLDVSTVSSNASGRVDLRELARILDAGPVAGIMLTNPNTLGLFEREIGEIAQMVHDNGGLLYYDGANLNPILGVVRPGDMGFDVIHLNLHKTFATPHGGGGPGAGPVLVGERLADFRPGPVVGQGDSGGLEWQIPARSIGRVHSWHGNALVLARAFAYMVALGGPGLRRVAEAAVLNANWLLNRLAGSGQFAVPYPGRCLHELVVAPLGRAGLSPAAHATKVAKALIGYGFHPPTINFPLVVPGALMIEPTETESPETLAALAEALCAAATDAEGIPPQLLTPVASLDEALAARRPRLSFTDLVASKADA